MAHYVLWLEHANLGETWRRKAARGARVRFLVGDPDSQVTTHREQIERVPLTVGVRIQSTLDKLDKLADEPRVEARFSDAHIAMSVSLFDQDALVSPHLASTVGHDSPLLHLRRRQDDGMFDRFAAHVDELWARARPIRDTADAG